jgi:hypothetical protein
MGHPAHFAWREDPSMRATSTSAPRTGRAEPVTRARENKIETSGPAASTPVSDPRLCRTSAKGDRAAFDLETLKRSLARD